MYSNLYDCINEIKRNERILDKLNDSEWIFNSYNISFTTEGRDAYFEISNNECSKKLKLERTSVSPYHFILNFDDDCFSKNIFKLDKLNGMTFHINTDKTNIKDIDFYKYLSEDIENRIEVCRQDIKQEEVKISMIMRINSLYEDLLNNNQLKEKYLEKYQDDAENYDYMYDYMIKGLFKEIYSVI